jgi:hypothetical protein
MNLTGHVSNSLTHGPVSNATVEVVSAGGNAGKWTTTNSAGDYTLSLIQQQEFQVSASHLFYVPATKTFTLTSTQSPQRLDFELKSLIPPALTPRKTR